MNKVLILYKKSAYDLHFDGKTPKSNNPILCNEIARLKQAHEEHYAALTIVGDCLQKYKIKYDQRSRGERIDYQNYHLIITVGGDGTFLEAARHIKSQIILGVNSSVSYSRGRYCVATINNFEKIFKAILTKKIKLASLQRLSLTIDGKRQGIEALNDILICHKNPAMLCRYYLKVGTVQEEQRNSGLWISTPTGCSGAIKSAGGKLISKEDKRMQYRPRELYKGLMRKYILTGGVLKLNEKIMITSLMQEGIIFVDGAHVSFPFEYGSRLIVSRAVHFLKTIKP